MEEKDCSVYSIRLKKPPLGLKPKYIHDAKRHMDVQSAIIEYVKEDYLIPLEWISEYNDFVKRLSQNEEGTTGIE